MAIKLPWMSERSGLCLEGQSGFHSPAGRRFCSACKWSRLCAPHQGFRFSFGTTTRHTEAKAVMEAINND